MRLQELSYEVISLNCRYIIKNLELLAAREFLASCINAARARLSQ